MQQIERVGVIALLLLVVTMVTVALWGDGEPQSERAGQARREQRYDSQKREDRGGGASRVAQDRAQQDRSRLPVNREAQRELPARRASSHSGQVSRPASESSLGRNLGTRKEAQAYAKAQELTSPRTTGPRTTGSRSERSRKAKQANRVPLSATRQVQPIRDSAHTYTVQAGDCLELIARDHCGGRSHIKAIMALNAIQDAHRIRVGQVLRLPTPVPNAVDGPAAHNPASSAKGVAVAPRTYVIQQGDTLSQISQRTLGTSKRWREFLELNKGLDPSRLSVGRRLQVPAGGTLELGETSLLASARVRR